MPRRRQSDEGGVSLFPFMSILACLIGVLTLLISVNMIIKENERDNITQEELDRAKENLKLKKQAEAVKKELAKLEERLQKEKAATIELEKLKERSIVLQERIEELAKAENPEESDAALQKILENLRQEIRALEREQPTLEKRKKELLAEIEKRKIPPKPNEKVIIRPGGVGSRTARHVFFVECNSTGIVLRREDQPEITVSTAAIPNNDQYGDFLEEVKRTRDSMVLFLVRKAGNEAYLWAAGHAEQQFEVRTGKLPVPKDGEIDLSLFEQ
ncbi:hypothetical protein [Roseibacillus ishigakijimensis]|uniref:Uncharacterized protein n=1 Tax=Roseibacillus ishigakijimensis TaxID=454146 RepID=A0A934RN93_9BACT|nr:hypothetical protein [Roseibacillus ishigakijimensis]MBK1832496.1 hypothetical protein [Roseibacillus ishigakijimensis]